MELENIQNMQDVQNIQSNSYNQQQQYNQHIQNDDFKFQNAIIELKNYIHQRYPEQIGYPEILESIYEAQLLPQVLIEYGTDIKILCNIYRDFTLGKYRIAELDSKAIESLILILSYLSKPLPSLKTLPTSDDMYMVHHALSSLHEVTVAYKKLLIATKSFITVDDCGLKDFNFSNYDGRRLNAMPSRMNIEYVESTKNGSSAKYDSSRGFMEDYNNDTPKEQKLEDTSTLWKS